MSNTSTKGERIEDLAVVARAGTAEFFPNPFEVPFLVFRLPDGRELLWHSPNASAAYHALPVGTEVALSGFAYDGRLRRVTVGKGCLVYGLGGK